MNRNLKPNPNQTEAYVAGDCCVTPGAELAYFVMCADTSRIFFFCPDCGCAWHEPPVPFVVDYIHGPADYAKRAVVLPTLEEIRDAGREDQIKDTLTIENLAHRFDGVVTPRWE